LISIKAAQNRCCFFSTETRVGQSSSSGSKTPSQVAGVILFTFLKTCAPASLKTRALTANVED